MSPSADHPRFYGTDGCDGVDDISDTSTCPRGPSGCTAYDVPTRSESGWLDLRDQPLKYAEYYMYSKI